MLVNSAGTVNNPSQTSYCRMGLDAGMGITHQSGLLQLPHHWARSPSEIIKDFGAQTDDIFSPSAHYTEATRRWITRFIRVLSKSAFILLNEGLVCPNKEYGMLTCSPNLVAFINPSEQIQRLATMLATSIPHVTYQERLKRLGLLSLQRRRILTDLITAFKIFSGM